MSGSLLSMVFIKPLMSSTERQIIIMELEKWLEEHNIKEMVMKDLEVYWHVYKEEEKEDFNELFKDMDFDKVEYVFHSVAYVINEWHRDKDDIYKYISAKVWLEYDGRTFAEYESIYGLDGEDDYLRMV